MSRRREWIGEDNELSIRQQCGLTGVWRSGLYYEAAAETAENLGLMRLMGLEAIYPKPRLSLPAPGHRICPYLLRGLTISRPDQAWCSDIESRDVD